MATYLLTWNPRQWDEWDDLNDQAAVTAKGKLVEGGWSCGNTKRIEPGDRVFLLRQGSDKPGMIGSGWATSTPKEKPHWNPKKRGKTTWFIKVDWDALVPVDKSLPRGILENRILATSVLNTQPSGISIDGKSATKLEKSWAVHLKRPVSIAAISQGMQSAREGEPTEYIAYRRKRDRRLRNEAMANSNGRCEACEKDFSRVLDKMGLRCLQVHHRKQLASTDAPRITKLTDLAVVCANCHSLIHFDPQKALRVETLRTMLRKAK